MTYKQLEAAVSSPRLQKYLIACNNNKRKAISLYKANIKLSLQIFGVLSVFEVVLRNSIDKHYRKIKGDDWFIDAIDYSTGYLNYPGCEHSLHTVNEIIQKLGNDYTHDKIIAALSFGFWTFQFGTKEYAAAGSTLLSVFTACPIGTRQNTIYKKLHSINKIRNRIAHHEPICFNAFGHISTNYALTKYNQIIELLSWLGFTPKELLRGFDSVRKEIDLINQLKQQVI